MALHPLTLDRLEEALKQSGCPVCFEMDRVTRRYLRALLREHKASDAVWTRLQRTWGLCRHHTRGLLAEEAQSLPGFAAATLYQWLAEALLKQAGWDDSGRWGRLGPAAFRALLKPEGICLACEQLDEYQRSIAQTLVSTLASGEPPGIRDAYLRGDGLCVPHLRLALSVAHHADTERLLTRHFLDRLDALSRELAWFREEVSNGAVAGAESDVWRRAVERFTGRLST